MTTKLVTATATLVADLTRKTNKAVDSTVALTPTVTKYVAKRVDNTVTITPDLTAQFISGSHNDYQQGLDATVAMTVDLQMVVIPNPGDAILGSFVSGPGRLQPNLKRVPPRKLTVREPVTHQVFLNTRIMFSVDGGTTVEEEVILF